MRVDRATPHWRPDGGSAPRRTRWVGSHSLWPVVVVDGLHHHTPLPTDLIGAVVLLAVTILMLAAGIAHELKEKR